MKSVRRLVAVTSVATLALVACGGSDDDAGSASSATAVSDSSGTDTTEASSIATTPAASATEAGVPADTTGAPDTTAVADTAPPATAVFDGPAFVDVIDGELAPYTGAIGRAADAAGVGAAAPLAADTPLPAAATIAGAGRTLDGTFADVSEEQLVGFDPAIAGTALETFGSAAPAGWTQNSFATSGSLTTLLLTNDADARRAVYVVQDDTTDTVHPPFELRVSPAVGAMAEPGWAAALPRADGGDLVEVIEGAGAVNVGFGVAGNGYVSARWRYPETALAALEAYLESGVVESAGFTYDRDLFNGFDEMVEVTAGDWAGSVIIGQASMNDEVFYDLVWTLQRA